MRNKKTLFACISLSFLILAAGCAKKTKPDQELPALPPAESGVSETTLHDSDSNNAMGLETIHFAYNTGALSKSAKETLKKNVGILKDHLSAHVQIEGHCDQRGGSQYNLALGERRAKSVRKYMALLGVASSRMTTISMGKEKPIDPSESEEAYAKNRRANFVVTE